MMFWDIDKDVLYRTPGRTSLGFYDGGSMKYSKKDVLVILGQVRPSTCYGSPSREACILW